jgi:hypothetical protein
MPAAIGMNATVETLVLQRVVTAYPNMKWHSKPAPAMPPNEQDEDAARMPGAMVRR